MDFEEFKCQTKSTVNIILLDLQTLKDIAEQVNKSISSTTGIETTKWPSGETNLKSDATTISRCTVPIVMVCFSSIDMFGQWLKKNEDDDFGTSAFEFFNKLLKRDDLNKETTQEKLRVNFRNCIMHSFFSSDQTSITYPQYESSSLFLDVLGTGVTLNAKYLLNMVCKGLEVLIKEIENESEIGQGLFSGYKRWTKSLYLNK